MGGQAQGLPLCYSVQHAHHQRVFLPAAGLEKERAKNVGCKRGESRQLENRRSRQH